MDKENALQVILSAARSRADTLEELASESEGYQDSDAAKQLPISHKPPNDWALCISFTGD